MTINITGSDCQPNEWDDFVRRQAGWTVFHLHGWRTVMESVFGHECLYLVARDQAELLGVLPLVKVRSRIFGSYLVSMPFVNYGGPLGDPTARSALTDAAVSVAGEQPGGLLELRSRFSFDTELPVSQRKITVLLDLPTGNPEDLWKGLKAKVRSQIRRPRKEGIRVSFGHSEISAFYDVYSRHMRDLGTPCMPFAFFKAVAERFPDETWVGCAYHRGTPVAGGFGLCWNGELEMTWAAALSAYRRMAPNMLLYWSFLERAAERGIRVFNFGRCSPGSGTHRFKRQWGGRDEPLWWYYAAHGSRATTPAATDERYRWGPRVWRHLPVWLTRWLGPRIVRWIP